MLGIHFGSSRESRGPITASAPTGASVAGRAPCSAAELAQSYAWCRRCTQRSRSNFYLTFFTLPRNLFSDMCVLYAFMRVTDDLGDDAKIPAASRSTLIETWRMQVELALDGGGFEHPALAALDDIVRRHSIPHEYLYAVIDGVQRDLDPKGFETFVDLTDYCYHVAGAVGLCCLHVWGFSDSRALKLAVDCGLAFQLTNILRDVGEDARMGRCYLPREDLRRFDLTFEDLRSGTADSRFHDLMAWEAARTALVFRQRSAARADVQSPRPTDSGCHAPHIRRVADGDRTVGLRRAETADSCRAMAKDRDHSQFAVALPQAVTQLTARGNENAPDGWVFRPAA